MRCFDVLVSGANCDRTFICETSKFCEFVIVAKFRETNNYRSVVVCGLHELVLVSWLGCPITVSA